MSIFSDLFLCACNVSMEVKAFQHPHSTWLSMFLANFWWLNLKHPKCGSGRESSSKNVVVSPLENHKSILFLDGPETISSFDAPLFLVPKKSSPFFPTAVSSRFHGTWCLLFAVAPEVDFTSEGFQQRWAVYANLTQMGLVSNISEPRGGQIRRFLKDALMEDLVGCVCVCMKYIYFLDMNYVNNL